MFRIRTTEFLNLKTPFRDSSGTSASLSREKYKDDAACMKATLRLLRERSQQ